MTNLLYLVIAVVLSLVGSLVLWLRTRQPRSMEAGIARFAKELKAIAPDHEVAERGRHS